MKSKLKLTLLATLLSGCAAVNEPIRDDATRIERSCLDVTRGGTTIDTFATPLTHPSRCIRLSGYPGGHTAYLFGDPCSEVGVHVRRDGMAGTERSGTVIAQAISALGTTTIATDYTWTARPFAHDVVADFGEEGVFRIVGEGIAASDDANCRITPPGI